MRRGTTRPVRHLRPLLRALVSFDVEIRRAARQKVARLGPAAVPELTRATKSPDANLRWEAVDSLGTIRDVRATRAVLERVLRDDDVHVRWRSIWAITSLDDGSVVPALLRALRGRDRTASWNAAVALSLFCRQEAVPILLGGLESGDAFQRWEAVNALGSVHDQRSTAALVSVLRRGSPDLRREAALSLGRTGRKAALPALVRALRGDEDPQVRWRAALALGRFRDPRVVGVLRTQRKTETTSVVKAHIRDALRDLGVRPASRVPQRGAV